MALLALCGVSWIAAGEPGHVGAAHAPAGVERSAASGEDRSAYLRSLRELERSLNAIRARHFGSVRVPDLRKEGMRRVRETLDGFARPLPGEAISAAVDVFEREANDVRLGLLSYIADQGTHDSDATLAWLACFERNDEVRESSLGMLVEGARARRVAYGVKLALDRALRSGDDAHAAASARVIEALGLLEAIPLLISAQVGNGGTPAEPRGVRAFILVGQQQTFVSGLTPVVGNGSVAFQPEISTLTTGSLLVVRDAVVTSYRTEVHDALVRMTSGAWGRSTAYLGWDVEAWRRWHAEVFVPHLEAVELAGMLGPRAPGE